MNPNELVRLARAVRDAEPFDSVEKARELARLSKVAKLGLTETIYPSATHSRLEHSLGILDVLQRLDTHANIMGHLVQELAQQQERTSSVLEKMAGSQPTKDDVVSKELSELRERQDRLETMTSQFWREYEDFRSALRGAIAAGSENRAPNSR